MEIEQKDDNITAASIDALPLRSGGAPIASQKNENNISELTEEKHIQAQSEHIKEKKKFSFKKWLKGNNKQEHIENISITTIIAAAVFLWFGMLLGSFVKYTVLLAVIGCFGLLIGICIYIASQMIEKE